MDKEEVTRRVCCRDYLVSVGKAFLPEFWKSTISCQSTVIITQPVPGSMVRAGWRFQKPELFFNLKDIFDTKRKDTYLEQHPSSVYHQEWVGVFFPRKGDEIDE